MSTVSFAVTTKNTPKVTPKTVVKKTTVTKPVVKKTTPVKKVIKKTVVKKKIGTSKLLDAPLIDPNNPPGGKQ